MEIFDPFTIKLIDQYNINNINITSLGLMENASDAFVNEFLSHFPKTREVVILAGPGNNGGDALAIARLLSNKGICVKAYLYCFNHGLSKDCDANMQKLKNLIDGKLSVVSNKLLMPNICESDIIIDGLFGIGLNRKLEDEYAELINFINDKDNLVVSVDVPSGMNLYEDTDSKGPIVHADYTFTFQFPKMKFLFAESFLYVGELIIINIGLKVPVNIESNNRFVTINDVNSLLKKRSKFDHKGCFGNGLLIAGNVGMAGAAVLAAKGSLKTGIGKLFVLTPKDNRLIVQIAVPEAIYLERDESYVNEKSCYSAYDCIAIGPGFGIGRDNVDLLRNVVAATNRPMVIDADALNIIADNKEILQLIPPFSVLTPHRGEFNRLFGNPGSDFNALKKASEFAVKYKLIIVLKGAFTKIVCPDGRVYVNSSGNPGMATAGSGDVLAGVILSFLAQGYEPVIAVILAVFIHGYAGDIAINDFNKMSLIASDIVNCLPNAVFSCHNLIKDNLM